MSVFDRFDAYTISARLLPFLVLVLPALLLLAAWLPIGKLELPSVAAALVPFAAAALVAHLGRDEGKRKQAALFSRWGGAPTTILLRHVSADLNKITRARYHARLAALLSHPLPSSAAEQQDPAAADAVYESCADLSARRLATRRNSLSSTPQIANTVSAAISGA